MSWWFGGGRKEGKEHGRKALAGHTDLPLRSLEAGHKRRHADAWQRVVGPAWAWLVCVGKGRRGVRRR